MAVAVQDIPEVYEVKPTLAECQEWVRQLDGEWGDLQMEMINEEAIYGQKWETNTREGTDPVKTGTAPADADSAVDSLTPSDMLIRVRPARNHEKYRKQAEKLQKFGIGLWHAWRKNKDVLRLVATDMSIRRLGVGRVLVDDSLWPDMPRDLQEEPVRDGETDEEFAIKVEDWEDRRIGWEARHRRKLPIVLELRDPRYVRWRENRSTGELLVVTEHYQTTVLEAWQTYGQYPIVPVILAGKEMNDRIWVDDVWFGRYRCILIEDRPIFPVNQGTPYEGVARHPYSDIPYVIAPYREIPADQPVDRYRGSLTNTIDLYPAESEAVTMALEIMRWMAWRTYRGHTIDARDLEIVPGLYVDLDKDKNEYLEPIEGTAIPPEIIQMAGTVGGFLQKNSVSNPGGTAGTRSAQQLMALNAEKEKKLDAPRQSLMRFCQRATSLAAMMLEENLDGTLVLPVPGHDHEGNDFGEVEIKPSDINGYYDGFEISFSRRLDPALLEVNKALMSFAQNNFISLRKALELGAMVDNPQEEIDELLDQATDRQPWMVEFLALKRAEQYYGEDSWQFQLMLQKFLQSQQAQKQGGGAAQGQPGQPGGLTGKPMQAPGGNRGAGIQANTGMGQNMAQQMQMTHAARPSGGARRKR